MEGTRQRERLLLRETLHQKVVGKLSVSPALKDLPLPAAIDFCPLFSESVKWLITTPNFLLFELTNGDQAYDLGPGWCARPFVGSRNGAC